MWMRGFGWGDWDKSRLGACGSRCRRGTSVLQMMQEDASAAGDGSSGSVRDQIAEPDRHQRRSRLVVVDTDVAQLWPAADRFEQAECLLHPSSHPLAHLVSEVGGVAAVDGVRTSARGFGHVRRDPQLSTSLHEVVGVVVLTVTTVNRRLTAAVAVCPSAPIGRQGLWVRSASRCSASGCGNPPRGFRTPLPGRSRVAMFLVCRWHAQVRAQLPDLERRIQQGVVPTARHLRQPEYSAREGSCLSSRVRLSVKLSSWRRWLAHPAPSRPKRGTEEAVHARRPRSPPAPVRVTR